MRIGWLAAAAVILGAALVPGVLRADEAEQAPDFKLTNLDGQEVELSKLRGSVVVLDFFATWCGPCRRALPYAQKLSQSEAAKSKDLVVMAVNVAEEREQVAAFVKEGQYTLPVLLDSEGAVARQYHVRSIPRFVVVDRAGGIRYAGHHNAEKIDAAVAAALDETAAE